MNNPLFYIETEVFNAGRMDDEVPFIGERYFIIAEYPNGTRLRHFMTFNGVQKITDEEGYDHFGDRREYATSGAAKLLARIQRIGKINLKHWRDWRPVYGSAAYSSFDEVMLEKRDAEDEAFGGRIQ